MDEMLRQSYGSTGAILEGKQSDLPGVFALISWGCTATKWLAMAMNSLPGVLALHHPRNAQQHFQSGPVLDDLEHLRALRLMASGYRLAGDVHGVDRRSIPKLCEFFGERFQAAVVIRDPEKRIISHMGLCERYDFDETFWPGLDYLKGEPGYAAVAHLVTDSQRRFFTHTVNCLNSIRDEVQAADVFCSEDLTSDPNALAGLIHHLSNGRLEVDGDDVAGVFSNRPVNSHRQHAQEQEINQPWQIEIIRSFLHPESVELYRKFGYEVPNEWCAKQSTLASQADVTLVAGSDAEGH